jgi:sec-independent protein translocase protein TatB
MFDIGWSELVLIGVVALIVIGPKELPAVLRAIGHWTTKIRRMAGEFQSQFQEAMREAEMSDLKKQVDGLGDAVKFDPLDPDPLYPNPKEATKWEPKKDSAADSKTDPKTGSETELAADATPDSASAAISSETQGDVVTAAEPAAAAESSPGHSPDAAPDAGAASEPHPAVPLAEGSGRA